MIRTKNDDRELLQAYAHERSHEAFAQLAGKYADMVFHTALRRTRDHQLAEDVTQAVFIVLARSAGTLKAKESIAGWLHQTAVFAAGNVMRAEARRRRHEKAAARAETNTHAEGIESSDLTSLLEAELHRLSAADRDLLILHYLQGTPIPQAADVLGISVDATHKRLGRALERLRNRLRRRGTLSSGAIITSSLGSIFAAPSTAHAAQVASAAIAGGNVGSAFTIASHLLHSLRLLALKKAAAVLAIVGLTSGLISMAAAQVTRTEKLVYVAPAPTTAPASRPATIPASTIDWRPVVARFEEARALIRTLSASLVIHSASMKDDVKVEWTLDRENGYREFRSELANDQPLGLHQDVRLIQGDELLVEELSLRGDSLNQFWVYPSASARFGSTYFSTRAFFGTTQHKERLSSWVQGYAERASVSCYELEFNGKRVVVVRCNARVRDGYEVYFFDPEKNALVYYESGSKNNDGSPGLVFSQTVEELKEYAPGLWLPIRYIDRTNLTPTGRGRTTQVTRLVINQPIDPAVFFVTIPKRSAIQDYRTSTLIALNETTTLPDFSIDSINSLATVAEEFRPGELKRSTSRPATLPASSMKLPAREVSPPEAIAEAGRWICVVSISTSAAIVGVASILYARHAMAGIAAHRV